MTLMIESYFTEGQKLWDTRAAFVTSRAFYEMWEKVCRPKPFFVNDDTIAIFDHEWTLPLTEGDAVGYYSWDGARVCAVLIIETQEWDAIFQLLFDKKGNPIVLDPHYVYHESAGFSHGERIEIMYDIVNHLQRKGLKRVKIANLDKKTFDHALKEVTRFYDEKAIQILSRLPIQEVHKLLIEALEDTPREEKESESDFYQFQQDREAIANDGKMLENTLNVGDIAQGTENIFPVHAQTYFQINEELRCLSAARRMVTQYEKICKIQLKDVTIVDDSESTIPGEYCIRFKVPKDLPVVEGDMLTVYGTSGDQEGTLMVDVYDGIMICGRIRFDDRTGPNKVNENLWALPVPSSAGYLAEAMDHLADSVERGGKNLSPATHAILGLNDVSYHSAKNYTPPKDLDETQARAWAESVDDRNPVVLVQGPPGTGKTTVLAKVLRTLVQQGHRLMVAAPSNAAVDNLIRRVLDLPVIRIGRQKEYIAPDIAQRYWEGDIDNIRVFVDKIKKFHGGAIFAGTQVSLMKSELISDEIETNGPFSAIVFDEAGMTRIEELMLCADMGNRAVLFGDHRQLLPFPLPQDLMNSLIDEYGGMPRMLRSMLERSALEWLCECRKFPTQMLNNCYRCQNPRLIRFSSTLFYNAAVKTYARAEYYRLPSHERAKLYPPQTLTLYNTAYLPPAMRGERVVYEGIKPGIENRLEAELCAKLVEDLATRYPLFQITVIVPYRRQVRLLRYCLNKFRERSDLLKRVGKGEWDIFLSMRISTVDSFQGGESDAVILSYVRSNEESGVGFVDDPNRINVAHTRCRRELLVVGDFACLKEGGSGRIFDRMERAFARDGWVVNVTTHLLSELSIYIPKAQQRNIPTEILQEHEEKIKNKPKKSLEHYFHTSGYHLIKGHQMLHGKRDKNTVWQKGSGNKNNNNRNNNNKNNNRKNNNWKNRNNNNPMNGQRRPTENQSNPQSQPSPQTENKVPIENKSPVEIETVKTPPSVVATPTSPALVVEKAKKTHVTKAKETNPKTDTKTKKVLKTDTQELAAAPKKRGRPKKVQVEE